MTFFTSAEFTAKYGETATDWQIEASCEMIFSQIGLRYREDWNTTNVPDVVKNASMEQLRFMLDYDIPFVDYDKSVKAGQMSADLKSDYSTLALRMLANAGYMYRGSEISSNMGLNVPFGE